MSALLMSEDTVNCTLSRTISFTIRRRLQSYHHLVVEDEPLYHSPSRSLPWATWLRRSSELYRRRLCSRHWQQRRQASSVHNDTAHARWDRATTRQLKSARGHMMPPQAYVCNGLAHPAGTRSCWSANIQTQMLFGSVSASPILTALEMSLTSGCRKFAISALRCPSNLSACKNPENWS